jgi:hypothetical protein
MSEEFPKMPTVQLGRRVVNLIWKPGHVKAGAYVVFEDAAAEAAFNKADAVPASAVAHHHGEDVYWAHARERVVGNSKRI